MQEKKYDFFVMGDINLDWYCSERLPITLSEINRNGVNIYTEISEKPGGSALNFARFSQESGFQALLFGRAGDDAACDYIEKYLEVNSIDKKIIRDSSMKTGKVFIGRDQKGVRLLVNEARNANRQLSKDDVESHVELLLSARALYISGYCFMHSDAPRLDATNRAMEIAGDSDIKIILDVVPHEFYKYYKGDFWQLTEKVYILISEVPTIRRYISKKETGSWGDKNEVVSHELAMETAMKLKEDFACQNFILRYGFSGCDHQIVCSSSNGIQTRVGEVNHNSANDTRGLGDKLAISALIEVFDIAPLRGTGSQLYAQVELDK